MKKKKSLSLFDQHHRLEKIEKQKDPLIKLNAMINWEDFRPLLESAFPVVDPKVGGRPPFDRVMMFKVLILQRLFNLSDDQTEFQILDRMSFMRFLGLQLEDAVPDSKTVWAFKEQLNKKDIFNQVFDQFFRKLYQRGLIVHQGVIVDASFVEAPRQHPPKEEDKAENPNHQRQKDTDADWTKKGNVSYFGYKNHVKIDQKSKLITNFQTTPASEHDSNVLLELLTEDDKGQELWADSAYHGQEREAVLIERGIKPRIQNRSVRHRQLTEEDKARNRAYASIRCRVEHIFGFMRNSLKVYRLRCKGIVRITGQIALNNLIYNLFRGIHLSKLKLAETI